MGSIPKYLLIFPSSSERRLARAMLWQCPRKAVCPSNTTKVNNSINCAYTRYSSLPSVLLESDFHDLEMWQVEVLVCSWLV